MKFHRNSFLFLLICLLKFSTISNFGVAAEMNASKLDRQHPYAGLADSGVFNGFSLDTGKQDLAVFTDEEISTVHIVSDGEEAKENENGKFVVLQPGKENCAAGVTLMILQDNDVNEDRPDIFYRSTGTLDNIRYELKLYDVNHELLNIEKNQVKSINIYQDLLNRFDSLILMIEDPNYAQHFIVLDSIDMGKQTARIRDPYHGWDISVKMEALIKRLNFENILGIAKHS